jgi:hypothetical protein
MGRGYNPGPRCWACGKRIRYLRRSYGVEYRCRCKRRTWQRCQPSEFYLDRRAYRRQKQADIHWLKSSEGRNWITGEVNLHNALIGSGRAAAEG